mgnify:CR=1 FL=1
MNEGVYYLQKEVVCLTIEVALLISGVSVAFGIFAGISNLRRNQKLDDKKDATEMTTVIVKLENISIGISEIKNEMANVKNDIKESRERIIKVEESAKQAHKRIDTLEKVVRGLDSDE